MLDFDLTAGTSNPTTPAIAGAIKSHEPTDKTSFTVEPSVPVAWFAITAIIAETKATIPQSAIKKLTNF